MDALSLKSVYTPATCICVPQPYDNQKGMLVLQLHNNKQREDPEMEKETLDKQRELVNSEKQREDNGGKDANIPDQQR